MPHCLSIEPPCIKGTVGEILAAGLASGMLEAPCWGKISDESDTKILQKFSAVCDSTDFELALSPTLRIHYQLTLKQRWLGISNVGDNTHTESELS
jgi:hypothetical protein